MAYQVPTLDQMQSFLVAMFKGLLPTRNIGSRWTFNWRLAKTIAGAVTDIHAHVKSAFRDLSPLTAAGLALDEWLGIVKPGGLATRKGATPSRKSNAGRVRGAEGATTTIGDKLTHRSSGLTFQIGRTATIAVGDTFVDTDIVAISTGSATRLEKGEILEFLAAPAGIETQVELQLALDEDGYDQEQDGAARNRLLDAMGTAATGGNQSDYVGWAEKQLGIAAAYCYPNRAGIGTIDIAALHAGSGTARELATGERAALLAQLKPLSPAPVGALNGPLRILETIAETANVEISLATFDDPQYAWDWDDRGGAPVVLSWDGTTRTLRLAGGTRPATMKAGDRLCLKGVASSQDGSVLVVEALSGADAIILQDAPTNDPAATDIAYAGGPLTSVIRDAVLAHINGDVLYCDSAGPLAGANAGSTTNLQLLADGLGTANPDGMYGSWSGGLLVSTLNKIAAYTRGVRTANVLTPATDQEPTDYAFPLDEQIGYLAPGYVLVRRA